MGVTFSPCDDCGFAGSVFEREKHLKTWKDYSDKYQHQWEIKLTKLSST